MLYNPITHGGGVLYNVVQQAALPMGDALYNVVQQIALPMGHGLYNVVQQPTPSMGDGGVQCCTTVHPLHG